MLTLEEGKNVARIAKANSNARVFGRSAEFVPPYCIMATPASLLIVM